jgi:hypothetical protein
MACVEIPADRKLRKRIAEGAYVDRTWWSMGEERRWRFGYGEGVLEQGERPVVGGVAPNFRWREWRGVQEELRAERKQIDDLIDKDMRAEQIQDQGASAYSLIPGQACHQCRRSRRSQRCSAAMSTRRVARHSTNHAVSGECDGVSRLLPLLPFPSSSYVSLAPC